MTQPIEHAADIAVHGDGNHAGTVTAMHDELGRVGTVLSQLYSLTGELAANPHLDNLIDAAMEAHQRGIPAATFAAAADVLRAAIRRAQPQVMP